MADNENQGSISNLIPTGRTLPRTPNLQEGIADNIVAKEFLRPPKSSGAKNAEQRKVRNIIPTGKQLARTPSELTDEQTNQDRQVKDVESKPISNAIPSGNQLARTPMGLETDVQLESSQQQQAEIANLVTESAKTATIKPASTIILQQTTKQDFLAPNPIKRQINDGIPKDESRRRQHTKRAGTGRNTSLRTTQTAVLPTPKYGNRTGFEVKKSVSKDDNGFEDINSFWGDTPVSEVPSIKRSTAKRDSPKRLRLSILSNPSLEIVDTRESVANEDLNQNGTASPSSSPAIKETNFNQREPSSVLKIASATKFASRTVLRESLDGRNLIKRRQFSTPLEEEKVAAVESKRVINHADLTSFDDFEVSPFKSQDSTSQRSSTQVIDRRQDDQPTQLVREEPWVDESDDEPHYDDDLDVGDVSDGFSNEESPFPTRKEGKRSYSVESEVEETPKHRKTSQPQTPYSSRSVASSAASGGLSPVSDMLEASADNFSDSEDYSSEDESLPAMTPRSSVSSNSGYSSRKKKRKSIQRSDDEDELEQMGERAVKARARKKGSATPGLRRSKRQRWGPLQHWKGERLIIRKGRDSLTGIEVPEVVAAAKPGTFKTPKPSKRTKSREYKQKEVHLEFETNERTTPVKVNVNGKLQHKVVIRGEDQLHVSNLPSSKRKLKKSGPKPKAPKAAAAFDDEKFLSGVVMLPPMSSKPRENTHECTQVFMVSHAQPKSVCVKVADKAYVLSEGDHFWIPTESDYSIENHSESVEAKLSFVLIKPFSTA